ncbi:MAG: cytochrome b/b6 domain-containing protein [Dehalococcoidales bacterium]
MLKRALFTLGLIAFIIVAAILWTHELGSLYSRFQVFRDTRLILIITPIVGAISGIIGATLKIILNSRKINRQPERHALDSILEHWGTAIGIFILIVSGIELHYHGGLPAVKLHFLGIFLSLLFGTYFLADFFVSRKYRTLLPNIKDIIDGTFKKYLLRMKFKETGKYLASQKASFLLFAVLGVLILVTGIIKLLFFYITIPFKLFEIATKVHDISAYLFILVLAIHILLVIARRANWPLLLSWFNGKNPEAHQPRVKTTGSEAKDPGMDKSEQKKNK